MMKKRINKVLVTMLLVAIFTSCATSSYHAPSGNPNYVPFKKFHGDTLAYAKKNFEDNKDFYIGKTVNTLFYDIEVYSQYGWILDRRNDFKEYGVEFRLSPFGRDYSKYKDMEITYVEIYFLNKNLPKIDMQKYSALQDEYMYQDVDLIWAWEPINSKFYGDCVIKDIRVCKYRYSNPPQEIYP